MSTNNEPTNDHKQPISLGAHQVPEERTALIKTHIAMLSATARDVSDQLAFGADVSDVVGVLETAGDNDGADQ